MADEDPLDTLAKRLKAHKPARKVTKTTRTLSLAEPEFTILQNYCRYKGVFVGVILDDLIKSFLERIKDDLPTTT